MVITPTSLRARVRDLDLTEEAGFGIIEVLVSALIVVLLSLGVFSAIDAAGRTASTNKARSAASNLATADQERLRSIPISDLTDLDATNPMTVDNRRYDVRSQGEYVVGSGQSAQCASTEAAPKYLKITSTVTWPGMTTSPVEQDSLRAMPNGTVAGRGSAAISVLDRDSKGVADLPVTLTGPQTVTGKTNSSGCVIFGFIPAGTYTVSFSRANYVEAKNPNRPTISDSLVVAVDAIASGSYQYDQAGSAKVNYVTNTAYAGTTWTKTTNGTEFSISNASLGTPNSKTFGPHSGATTSPAYGGNFPFTSNYEAWSGACSSNRPGDGTIGSLAVSRGGTGTATVREYRLRLTVMRRVGSNTGNYATMPNDGKTTVKLYGGDCTGDTAASWVSNTGSATGTSSNTANYSTYEAVVPWGTYSVCVAYYGSSSNSARNYGLNAATTTATGTTYPSGTAHIEVPYNQSSNYTCP